MDGDGWGDNQTSFFQPDAFPLQPSQWNDFDGDGYGDNTSRDAYQSDICPKEYGTSSLEEYGCIDSDSDGRADIYDPCPWDLAITNGVLTGLDAVTCSITSDPSSVEESADDAVSLIGDSTTLIFMTGAIVLLLGLIFVAQVAKAASKRKASAGRAEERKVNLAFSEEEERRLAWIDHYVAAGELDEARALGWVEPAEVPQWKQHEMQEAAATQAAIPTMMDLDKL
jgi:hypothetical protein